MSLFRKTQATTRRFLISLAGVFIFLSVDVPIAFGSDDKGPRFYSGLDVGYGSVDEDWFFSAMLEQGFSFGGLDVALWGPLRFRVIDNDPQDDGALREQDWDEPSDFARIARSVTYFHEWDDAVLDIRFGELNGIGVGHGSVMDCYFNSTDMDHYQGGLTLDVDYAGSGLELVTENVVKPEILLGRVYIAPLAWFIEGDWPTRLVFGYTLGADISAPRRTTADNPTTLPVTGGDVSLTLLDNDVVELTPYLDMMAMDGDLGLHAGLATSWALSQKRNVFLHLRGEYRRLGGDSHPAIFNPFYEYNRRHYGMDHVTDLENTLADSLANDELKTSDGFMAHAVFDWDEKVRVGARYDSEGRARPHWVMFRLDVSPVERFSLAGFYSGQDRRRGAGVFSVDSLIGASVHYQIIGPLRAFSEFTRRWRRVDATMDWANESAFGVGLLFSY